MSIIIMRGGFHVWPDLLSFLVEILKQAGELSRLNFYEISIVEASIQTIAIIVEDCSSLFTEPS